MLTLNINGEEVQTDADPTMPILWFLRDVLHLTGSKYGCGMGVCGACSVLVDGQVARGCLTPISQLEGKLITSIEGLDADGKHPLQVAWTEHNVPQCGYCQTGQIMQAASLLHSNPAPSADQVMESMDGNICRCGTYQRIIAAVQTAAKELAS